MPNKGNNYSMDVTGEPNKVPLCGKDWRTAQALSQAHGVQTDVNKINKDIKVGSRIVFLRKVQGTEDRFDKRFMSWRRDRHDTWGLPVPPEDNVYTVEKNSDGEFVIKYMPPKEYFWDKDRKNKNCE